MIAFGLIFVFLVSFSSGKTFYDDEGQHWLLKLFSVCNIDVIINLQAHNDKKVFIRLLIFQCTSFQKKKYARKKVFNWLQVIYPQAKATSSIYLFHKVSIDVNLLFVGFFVNLRSNISYHKRIWAMKHIIDHDIPFFIDDTLIWLLFVPSSIQTI